MFQTQVSSFLTKAYRVGRKSLRQVLVTYPAIDQNFGHFLVSVDARLHQLGLLRSFDASTDRVTCHGLDFVFRDSDIAFARQLWLNGDYEAATRETILSSLKADSVFVDVGAHIGYFTLLAARKIDDSGRVFAFEPSRETRETLERNLEINHLSERVTVVPFATSDRTEALRFITNGPSEARGIALQDETSGVELIQATSLDSYFSEQGWPRIDVIKLDVEGQELKTLRGMKELVVRNPDVKIIFEYHLGQIKRLDIQVDDLFEVLREMGLKRYKVLFRTAESIELPKERTRLDRYAMRANVNVMASR